MSVDTAAISVPSYAQGFGKKMHPARKVETGTTFATSMSSGKTLLASTHSWKITGISTVHLATVTKKK